MKKLRVLAAILLALVLVLAMPVTAFATQIVCPVCRGDNPHCIFCDGLGFVGSSDVPQHKHFVEPEYHADYDDPYTYSTGKIVQESVFAKPQGVVVIGKSLALGQTVKLIRSDSLHAETSAAKQGIVKIRMD